MSLVVDRVTAGYSGTEVLRDVSLKVPTGRVVALLGPNGAGKTTLLRVCTGVLRPKRGRLVLDGQDITGEPANRRSRQGMCSIPEGRAVFPSLTVAENLRLMTRGGETEAQQRAIEAFPALRTRLDQVASTMSGGEQQMLALARAYINEPRFVLLDEVSMGLAPIVVDEIFSFLAGLARAGVALLVVEQYAAKALALADVVYVLQKGRVTFVGEPAELDVEALAESYLGSDRATSAPVPTS